MEYIENESLDIHNSEIFGIINLEDPTVIEKVLIKTQSGELFEVFKGK